MRVKTYAATATIWQSVVAFFFLVVVMPTPSSAKRLDAGASHTCMVTTAGTVRCWGDNSYGELGDGTLMSSASPVDVVGLDGVVEVAAGGSFTCALLGSGDVKCWGYSANGQAGIASNFTVSVPTAIQGLGPGVRAIRAGSGHVCALTAVADVRCWGSNAYGQLGNGQETWSAVPVVVIGLESGVSSIAVGTDASCALTTAGGVKCWGRNAFGVLGDGTTTDRSSAVDVEGLRSGVTAVALGSSACALMARGELKCWGPNIAGQLGTGFLDGPSLVPVDVTVVQSPVRAVAVGGAFTCAATTVGVRCWGAGESGQLGNGWTKTVSRGVDVVGLGSNVIEISALMGHVCVMRSNGEALCWGNGWNGQLGNGMPYERRSPVAVAAMADGIASIAAGYQHTCAVRRDNFLECWGGNMSGELGNGTELSSPWPVDFLGVGAGIASVSAGSAHTCAVTVGGQAFCWGWNGGGQLGDGSYDTRPSPVAVANLERGEVATVAAGGAHNCALTKKGGVKCWGENSLGQMGDGSIGAAHLVPSGVTALESDVVSIAAGFFHTCAATSDGAVKCWGQNGYGVLGDGTLENRAVPTNVVGLGGEAIAVSALRMNTCALLRDGRVTCWGNGRVVPQFVDGVADASAIAVGAEHACALTGSGKVECWGSNWNGQLGDAGNVDQAGPVPVDVGAPVRAISAGSEHTCAVRVDGIAKCWGSNASGQLGNGEAGYSTVPVMVSGTFAGRVLRSGHAHHARPEPLPIPATPANRRQIPR